MRIRIPPVEIDEEIVKKMRHEKAETGKFLHAIVEEALRERYKRREP